MSAKSVYVVQHVAREDEADEDVKLVGVYSSRAEARAAVARLRGQPGFCDAPNGFHIDEYQLDKDHWSEGFGSAAQDQSTASRSA
jgi:homoserine kinase type II